MKSSKAFLATIRMGHISPKSGLLQWFLATAKQHIVCPACAAASALGARTNHATAEVYLSVLSGNSCRMANHLRALPAFTPRTGDARLLAPSIAQNSL